MRKLSEERAKLVELSKSLLNSPKFDLPMRVRAGLFLGIVEAKKMPLGLVRRGIEAIQEFLNI